MDIEHSLLTCIAEPDEWAIVRFALQSKGFLLDGNSEKSNEDEKETIESNIPKVAQNGF